MLSRTPDPPIRNGDILSMKFFIDTANLDDIRDLAETGLVDGVTTKPTCCGKSPTTSASRCR
jgi:transaldolase